MQFLALANTGVQKLTPYQPGKPIEELQRELGLGEIIKMASNETEAIAVLLLLSDLARLLKRLFLLKFS